MTDTDGEKAPGLLERIPGYTVPGLLLVVPILAWLASLLSPSFYRNIVWQYYTGPIVADAKPGDFWCSNDQAPVGGACDPGHVMAEAGYNLVNTLSWAVLLAVCIVGIAQMLRHFRHPADNRLILGATAWVVTGAVWHVLQDSKLFAQPLEYFFITPPIYLMFGAFGIASFLIAQYARHVVRATGELEAGLQKIWFVFVIIVLG